jgi:hypothetical protein
MVEHWFLSSSTSSQRGDAAEPHWFFKSSSRKTASAFLSQLIGSCCLSYMTQCCPLPGPVKHLL